jgi:hypothetical protein
MTVPYTPDPHIAVIGPLALARLRGECPIEVLRDAVAETGWEPPEEVVRDHARWTRECPHLALLVGAETAQLEAIVRYWRECQATAALRAAPSGGAGTYYHETPR